MALSLLFSYQSKKGNAQIQVEKEKCEIESNEEYQSWSPKQKGDYFLDLDQSESDNTVFLSVYRYNEAVYWYTKAYEDALEEFDYEQLSNLFLDLGIVSWKKAKALKIWNGVYGPLFRSEHEQMQQSYKDAIRFLCATDTMSINEQETKIKDQFRECVDNLMKDSWPVRNTWQEWFTFVLDVLDIIPCKHKDKMYAVVCLLDKCLFETRQYQSAWILLDDFVDQGSKYNNSDVRFLQEKTVDFSKKFPSGEIKTKLIQYRDECIATLLSAKIDTSGVAIYRTPVDDKPREKALQQILFLKKTLFTTNVNIELPGCYVYDSLLHMYSMTERLTQNFIVNIVDENDSQGCMRLFDIFWEECVMYFFEGRRVKIPKVVACNIPVMRSLGLILTHQLLLTGTIPSCISTSFLSEAFMHVQIGNTESMVDDIIPPRMLLDDLYQLLDESIKDILQKMTDKDLKLNQEEQDKMDTFCRNIGFASVCKSNPQLPFRIAQHVLLTRPKPMARALVELIPDHIHDYLWLNLTPKQIHSLKQRNINNNI